MAMNPASQDATTHSTDTTPLHEQPVDARPHACVTGFGRIPVTGVSPVVEGGVYPAKAVVGELIPIRATVFREGHDAVNASVILTDPQGHETRHDMAPMEPRGLDPWETWVRLDAEGAWTFRVEGWSDPWATFRHNALAKLGAGIDIPLVCAEGRALFERTATLADSTDPIGASVLRASAMLLIPERPASDLMEVIDGSGLHEQMSKHAPRDLVSPTVEYPIYVDRRRALYGSWYEFFPRSQGAEQDASGHWRSGTFRSSMKRLDEVAQLGFDVVYVPPVHPIGSAFKKGKNNSLDATADDPGSPWAIGSAAGGHDAIHPDLGTMDDFDAFVAHANELGMEVAIDFALQASPDHPWVTSHPEWFTTRVDGTIAYAENPPKKYQDIYPINFDNDPEGIYHEVVRILRLWISHGVKIFRVDNPHTKPLNFWAWVMADIRRTNPEVLFFAEAFTTPAMMQGLGKAGFHMGYSYFVWRETKAELTEYLLELSRTTDAQFRPNFFVNTPDINPYYLQNGNPAMFAIRAILAATMSPNWGMYSGYELCEHEPVPGREEYLNSEKYEYRPRDYASEPNLNMLIGDLNDIRRRHPALQQLRRIDFHDSGHDKIIAFSKRDQGDDVLVICSLDPENTVEGELTIDMAALGRSWDDTLDVRDELTGATFTWGERNYVKLYPAQPAHILHIL